MGPAAIDGLDCGPRCLCHPSRLHCSSTFWRSLLQVTKEQRAAKRKAETATQEALAGSAAALDPSNLFKVGVLAAGVNGRTNLCLTVSPDWGVAISLWRPSYPPQ